MVSQKRSTFDSQIKYFMHCYFKEGYTPRAGDSMKSISQLITQQFRLFIILSVLNVVKVGEQFWNAHFPVTFVIKSVKRIRNCEYWKNVFVGLKRTNTTKFAVGFHHFIHYEYFPPKKINPISRIIQINWFNNKQNL